MIHASLFSGIGGPEVAAAMLGWDNAFHCEINPFGRAVLEYWFPNSKSYDDITKTDFKEWRGKIDVLTGGFPCQPFSYAGKRGGREDERYLWPQMLRAIDEIRPTWVVGENVAGITTMVEEGVLIPMGCDTTLFGEGDGLRRYELRQSFTIERICRDLEGLGYSVQPVLIPAAAVGAPHRRDRIFIIAHSDVSRTESLRSGRENTIHRFESSSDPDGRRSREIPAPVHSGESDGDKHISDGCKRVASDSSNIGCWNSFDIRTEEEVCREMERERDRSFGNIPITTNGIRRATTDTLRTRCAGKNESRNPQGKKRMRIWGNINGCSRSDLLPENRWRYDEKGKWIPTVPPIHRGNDGLPFSLDDLTISTTKWRTESLKAYGNAIVPQVMYRIFQAIEQS